MSQFIPLQDAIDMTSLYRQYKEVILATSYKNLNILPKCETFDRGDLDDILAQNDCVAIRVYYSMDSNYKVHAVIVGVDSNDADILPKDSEKIMENATRCPTTCPPASSLNS
jgi:hypothetical protein